MGREPTLTEPAHERLAATELERQDLLAVSHLHRYELAAELCAGARVLDLCCGTGYGSRLLATAAQSVHGVDVAAEAIDAARAELGEQDRDRITFEQGDALEFLRGLGAGRFDAIVCIEGVEHVPDPDAVLDELSRLRRAGARILVSLPNSRGFEEENDYHVTDYGYEEMQAAADRLGDAVVVEQHLAEASVLRRVGATGDIELRGSVRPSDEDDGSWANHWLLLTGVDAADLEGARASLTAAITENQNGYMRLLERANADLRRHNARLARQWLGIHDAGAAAVLRRLEDAAAEAKHWESEARKWKQIADQNDWAAKVANAELDRVRHRAVIAVSSRLSANPGGRAIKRLLGRGRGA